MATVRRLLLASILIGPMLATSVRADELPCPVTLAQLKKVNLYELDCLFEPAPPGEIPVGYARGRVLLMVDARCPKLRACMASSVWKGKTFDESGGFINQFPGFQAL